MPNGSFYQFYSQQESEEVKNKNNDLETVKTTEHFYNQHPLKPTVYIGQERNKEKEPLKSTAFNEQKVNKKEVLKPTVSIEQKVNKKEVLKPTVSIEQKIKDEKLSMENFHSIFPFNSSKYYYDQERLLNSSDHIHKLRMMSVKSFCNSTRFKFNNDARIRSITLLPKMGWYECHIPKTGLTFVFSPLVTLDDFDLNDYANEK